MKKKLLLKALPVVILALFVSNCKSTVQATANVDTQQQDLAISEKEEEAFKKIEGDTISIASEETEYEIIIIEPGFNYWLQSIARPEWYYSQSFLEARNQVWVISWNQRVMQPQRFNPQLYEMQNRLSFEYRLWL